MKHTRLYNARFVLAFLCLALLLWPCGAAMARSGSSGSPKAAVISPLRPPALVPAPNGNGEEKRPDFAATGVIDAVADDSITVSDTLYRLEQQTKFYNKDLHAVSRSGFTEGAFVGVVLDRTGKVLGLYLLQ